MARYAPGNFSYRSDVIPARELESQVGKFGYLIWHDRLCKDSQGNLFIDAKASLERKRNGAQELLVEAVKDGLEVMVVGDALLEPGVPRDAKRQSTSISVVRIKVGGKTYTQWNDELQYYSISDMPTGEKYEWFIERRQVTITKTVCYTSRRSGIKKKDGNDRLSIRRLGRREYQVQVPQRGWVRLALS